MANLMNSPAPMEDQAKLLDEVLNVVRIQAHQMNNCLVRAEETCHDLWAVIYSLLTCLSFLS